MVSLRRNSNNNHFCGAVVFDRSGLLLSAAHCFQLENLTPDDIHAHLNGNNYRVTSIVNHERFNSTTIENDIAILRLDRPVSVPLVCLPPPNMDFTDSNGLVLGNLSNSESSK